MATNFSPCKGSYVLNQFPSNVMFGMNGFHVSASGAIQGHHGPLVNCKRCPCTVVKEEKFSCLKTASNCFQSSVYYREYVHIFVKNI